MDKDKLDRIAKISQDTNELSKRTYEWEKEGESIKEEIARINTALLQEFRDEAAK